MQVSAFHGTVTVHNCAEIELYAFIYLFDQIKLFSVLMHCNKCAVLLQEKLIKSWNKTRYTTSALYPVKSGWEEAFSG